MDVFSDSIRVAVVNYSNFFTLKKISNGEWEGIGGIEYDFLKILFLAMKVNFTLVHQEDNAWGKHLKNGNWTGIIGKLVQNDADIAISTIDATPKRMKVVDFSFPYEVSGLSFAIKKAGNIPRHFVYLEPFQFRLWLLYFLSLLACSAVLALVKVVDQNVKRKVPLFCKAMLHAIAVFTGNASFDKISTKIYVKAFIAISLLFFRVFILGYTTLLLVFLMAPVTEPQISTFAQLTAAVQKDETKVTAYEHSSFETFLLSNEIKGFTYLGKHIRQHPDDALKLTDSYLPWTLRGFAILDSHIYHSLHVYEHGLLNDIFISPDSLQTLYSTIASRKDFPFKKKFDQMIIRLYQAGIFDKLLGNQLHHLLLKAPIIKKADIKGTRPITLSDIVGIFWILIPLYGLSMLVFLLERSFTDVQFFLV